VKASEFIEAIREEMEESGDLQVVFDTIGAGDLELLSIYELDDEFHFDIGTDEDNDERNAEVAGLTQKE